MTARKRFLISSACVVALTVIGFALLNNLGDEPFSSAAWLATDKFDREKYVHNLKATVLKRGIEKNKVLELLGKPDSAFDGGDEEVCIYIVGRARFYSMVELLDLRFVKGRLAQIIERSD